MSWTPYPRPSCDHRVRISRDTGLPTCIRCGAEFDREGEDR